MVQRTIKSEDLSPIKEVIEAYAKGADTRNLDALDTSFHDHFRVVAMTPEGVRNLDKQTYLQLIRDEKIGGVDRSLDIEWITADGDTARAEVTLSTPKAVFHDDLALIRDSGTWQIVNNVTRVEAI
jgi:hypothetical protein